MSLDTHVLSVFPTLGKESYTKATSSSMKPLKIFILEAINVGTAKHKIEGINSRLDGIQAAILNVKLPHILEWTNQRIKNANYYNSKLYQNNNIPVILFVSCYF